MSEREEKQSAKMVLKEKLKRLKLDKSPAAKLVIDEVEKQGVSADLAEGIGHLVEFALHEQKKAMQDTLNELPD